MIALLSALLVFGSPTEDEILSTIDDFFIALEAADRETLERMVAEDAILRSLRRGESGVPVVATQTRDAWLGGLEGQGGKIVEVYWDPDVKVSPLGLAEVWAPYFIEYEGRPIHCGIDHFTLVRSLDGWIVTGLHDTRDPEGCERLGYPDARSLRPGALVGKLLNRP
jgi:hypothetical protein